MTTCQCGLEMDSALSKKRKRDRLEEHPVKSCQLMEQDLSYFCECNRRTDYRTWVSDVVSKRKGHTASLKSPPGVTLTIGILEDAVYKDDGIDNLVDGWSCFYLPQRVHMLIIGEVKGTLWPCDQLVLMTCENKKIYAYDGEELHEVAKSLRQLCEEGLEYPSSKSYYKGEAFKDMTKEQWDRVKNSAEGKKLDTDYYKLVTANKETFLAKLAPTEPDTGAAAEAF